MTGWRPNLYVVARFLDALHQGARSRSELQAAAGVNYDIFRRYLGFLEERALVAQRPDGALALTPAGARTRSELRAWLARFLEPPLADEGTRRGAAVRSDPDRT